MFEDGETQFVSEVNPKKGPAALDCRPVTITARIFFFILVCSLIS
jgi:hypothetical protein